MSGQPRNNENQPYENINNVVENDETELSDDEMNDVSAGIIPLATSIVIPKEGGGEDMPPRAVIY
jgi:hypothetical protein